MKTQEKIQPNLEEYSVVITDSVEDFDKKVFQLSEQILQSMIENRQNNPTDFVIKFRNALQGWEDQYIEAVICKVESEPKLHNKSRTSCSIQVNQHLVPLAELVGAVLNYPLKGLSQQLKQRAKDEKIGNYTAVELVKNTKEAIFNSVLDYMIWYENQGMEASSTKEIEYLRLDYILQNKALQLLKPKKYKAYLQLLYDGIQAFHRDMKSHSLMHRPYVEIVDLFFEDLTTKIAQLSQKYMVEFEINKQKDTKDLFEYPGSVFLNFEAFQCFTTSKEHAKCAEDIGFLFRYFSEKCYPSLIVAKETVFRTWYNQKIDSDRKSKINNSENTIRLNTPIKTLARIKGHHSKELMIPKQYRNQVKPSRSVKTTIE